MQRPSCSPQGRIPVLLAAAITLLIGSRPGALQAQEPSGLQAATAIESAMVEAIARAEQSVVAIARVKKDDGAEAFAREPAGIGKMTIASSLPQPGDPDFVPNEFGTGVIIDRAGLILTNYHVIDLESDHYVTRIDGTTKLARIKAADPRSDLAVLEIDASDLTPITLGDASTLRKGQIVIALGNPYSIARDGEASASWGIVANLSRKVAPTPDETSAGGRKDKLYHFGTLIQTDAKLNLGTSGGALLNLKGEMIGLTTSLAATAGFEQAAGYAIPVDETFRRVLENLKAGREVEYGFLGISPRNLGADELRSGMRGVLVEAVVRGTPAHRLDIKPYDLITRIDGEAVRNADSLMLYLGRKPADSKVKLTLVREQRRPLSIDVDLSKFPVRGQKIVTAPTPSWRGMRIDYGTASPEYHKESGRSDFSQHGCVVVTEVEPNTPAAAAGLTPGMFISHVENTAVRTPGEFYAAAASGPVKVRLTFDPNQRPVRTIEAE